MTFPEQGDRDLFCDFDFAVDVLTNINELNTTLQGKDLFAHEIYTNVKAFQYKLTLLSE